MVKGTFRFAPSLCPSMRQHFMRIKYGNQGSPLAAFIIVLLPLGKNSVPGHKSWIFGNVLMNLYRRLRACILLRRCIKNKENYSGCYCSFANVHVRTITPFFRNRLMKLHRGIHIMETMCWKEKLLYFSNIFNDLTP